MLHISSSALAQGSNRIHHSLDPFHAHQLLVVAGGCLHEKISVRDTVVIFEQMQASIVGFEGKGWSLREADLLSTSCCKIQASDGIRVLQELLLRARHEVRASRPCRGTAEARRKSERSVKG